MCQAIQRCSHQLNCSSPNEPSAHEVFDSLKITTSYLSFLLFLKILLRFECKEFSRIVCVSLFSYQGFCLATALLDYHTIQHLSTTFFKFFWGFSQPMPLVFVVSVSSRWRPDYFIIYSVICQQLFLFFWNILKLYLSGKQLFPTAQLEYHNQYWLSTTFFI